MGPSRTRNTVDSYRGYTSDHSTASAVTTHTGFSVTGGVEHSTGDPIIPLPPWFYETPPLTRHEEILPPVPSVDETPPLKTAQAPETPTTPSVAKRGRSDTLHPETPVPTTTSPRLRWRAGVLRALRPFRRLPDKQPDSSEVREKRLRLVPARVMSIALPTNYDWSLGVDGRGPCSMKSPRIGAVRFFSQDVRQEKRFILLRSPERISGCCLGPWHVNGRNGRSTRQHCH